MSRLTRYAPLGLVGILPALLLSIGVARYILNHFFVHAPYLLDSGLLSGVTYRSGLVQETAPIAINYATSFYQVYFSPLVSVFSGLSYLVPVPRIEWYAFVQALVYAPIGFGVYMVASRATSATTLQRIPIALIAALAFTFSGLVLWTVGYPHYEIATSGLACLVLAAVVTGRTKTAWICLGLAASVRQDAGGHVALALLPLLYLHWRGVTMSPSRRKLLVTIGVAIGATIAAFVLQKLLFTPVDRLRPIYFGTPAYSHLTWTLLADRVRFFAEHCQVIYYPFLATVLLAGLRRDPRYLLGWLATLPWFLFSFTAFDDQKSHFTAYTVSPFLAAMFWVYLYGALLAPAERRLRSGALEAVFALICVASTLGAQRAAGSAIKYVFDEMAHARPRDRRAVHRFVRALETFHYNFGRLSVDSAVAALVLDGLSLTELWSPERPAEAVAFHLESPGVDADMPSYLARNRLDVCTHPVHTSLYLCTHGRPPPEMFAGLKVEVVPAVLAFSYVHPQGVRPEERGIVIANGATLGMWLGPLRAGTYALALQFAADSAGQDIALVESTGDNVGLAPLKVRDPSRAVALKFTVDGRQKVDLGISARVPALVLTGAQLRVVPAAL